MARNQVIVSITSNTKGLTQGLGQSQGALAKFGAAAGVAVAAVGAFAVAVGVKAVGAASELEQNMGAMDAVFKKSAGQMDQWATGAATSLGLAKSEYAGLATILGSQMKNMGVAADDLADQTHDLIGMGADLAAQFGGSTSDAVSALSSLLRGERDPIERYGVSINEAAVKAKMAELGLEGLSGEAEKNAKLQATLALLNEQTADAMGAFAREADTLAGAQQRVSARTENISATIGESLLPAVTAVTQAAGEFLGRLEESEAFETFTGWLATGSEAVADFIGGLLDGSSDLDFSSLLDGLLPAIIDGIQRAAAWITNGGLDSIVQGIASGRESMLDAAIEVFGAISQALPEILPVLMDALVTLLLDLVNLLVDSMPSFLDAATTMFTALIDALVLILPPLVTSLLEMLPELIESLLSMIPMLLDAATELFTALVDALPIILPPLVAAIVATLPKLVQTIIGMVPKILKAAIDLFTALVESLPIILPLLLDAILDLLPVLIETVVGMIPQLLQAAVQLFTGIVDAIPKVLPPLVVALVALAPKMIKTLLGMIPQLLQAGADLIGGLVQGLKDAGASVGAALLDIATAAVDGFLSFLGIKSPSRLFMSFGKNTVQGLADGIRKNGQLVDHAMDGLSDRVADGFHAELSPGEMDLRGGRAGASVYYITVNALQATAETGRLIVESIRAYEAVGGREHVMVGGYA